jgi:hypothetical protein
MDIFFHDPDDVPLPPDEVHIRQFNAQPYPDGRRVRVYLEISPFQKRPSAEISILDAEGREVANVNIIETIDPRMEMTMHLRSVQEHGAFTIRADLFYETLNEEPNGDPANYQMPERILVAQAEDSFEINHAD